MKNMPRTAFVLTNNVLGYPANLLEMVEGTHISGELSNPLEQMSVHSLAAVADITHCSQYSALSQP
jgi:hypothetical protein